MELTYFDTKGASHLLEEIFQLSFSEEDLPFRTTIVPVCLVSITHIYANNQYAIFGKEKFPLIESTLTGQFYGTYDLIAEESGDSFGCTFHPTALHKLTNLDISTFSNSHTPLNHICEILYNKLNPIFNTYREQPTVLAEQLKTTLTSYDLQHNNNIQSIDDSITLIRENDGMITVLEILKEIPLSQKTLETQFKKIVGLTPGKYIRMYRFLKLMRKYGSKEIDLKDLIYMYNYHDESHFSKDFKRFMHQTPKSYFKKDYPLLREYLKHEL